FPSQSPPPLVMPPKHTKKKTKKELPPPLPSPRPLSPFLNAIFKSFVCLCIAISIYTFLIDCYLFKYPVSNPICGIDSIPTVSDGVRLISSNNSFILCKNAETYNDVLLAQYVDRLDEGTKTKEVNDNKTRVADELYITFLVRYQMALTRNLDKKNKDIAAMEYYLSYFLSNSLTSIKCTRVDQPTDKSQYKLLIGFCSEAQYLSGSEDKDGKPAIEALSDTLDVGFLFALLMGEFRNETLAVLEVLDAHRTLAPLEKILRKSKQPEKDVLEFLANIESESLMVHAREVTTRVIKGFNAMTYCDPLYGDTWSTYLRRALLNSADSSDCSWNTRGFGKREILDTITAEQARISALGGRAGSYVKHFFNFFSVTLVRFPFDTYTLKSISVHMLIITVLATIAFACYVFEDSLYQYRLVFERRVLGL
ncbi:hypothetical protein PFISCL1PPCAC_20534, partial [Pristionchus fissidentatus]